MGILSFMIIAACMLVPSLEASIAADSSIRVSQSISDDGGKTLVSQGGTYELGFFSPGSSSKRYLGIWCKNIPIQTVVWVANGANPINDTSGVLTVNSTGNLVLSQNDSVVWYTTLANQAQNPVAELLNSGNLVVRNEGEANPETYLWQSFDYPSNTIVPGMKLGWDLRNGMEWRITSWKSPDDPSPGEYSWGLVLHSYPEFYIMKGRLTLYRLGPWNGLYFSGLPELEANPIYEFKYVTNSDANYANNKDEMYYTYTIKDNSIFSRVVINQTGFQLFLWAEAEQALKIYASYPRDQCDENLVCGPFGNCVIGESPPCQCLRGFSPKSPQAWASMDFSKGCVRNKPLSCNDADVFVKFKGLKVPDTTQSWLDENMGIEECRSRCLKNCSCMAYTNSDISGAGSGCVIWFGDLIDIKQFDAGGQDLYIRMAATELGISFMNFAQ